MDDVERTVAEERLWQAFPRREPVDLSEAEDRTIRASVVRALMLGAQVADPGHVGAIIVVGAHVTGVLDVSYGDVAAPVRMARCEFDSRIEMIGTHLRELNLEASTLRGLRAAKATLDGNLNLDAVRCTGPIELAGACIDGALVLDRARLRAEAATLDASRLFVGQDLRANFGFTSDGEIVLDDAKIDGSLLMEGATINSPVGRALTARGLTVGAVANLNTGFTANGRVSVTSAQVGSRISFGHAHLSTPDGEALSCRHLRSNQLVLETATRIDGEADLTYAHVGVLWDDPATWPDVLHLQGFTYDAIRSPASLEQRLTWLRREPSGYLPEAYDQLAAFYRRLGHDDQARAVLLAGQRHRRETLKALGKVWGRLQDGVLGYGYRPWLAALWLLAAWMAGAVFFEVVPPQAQQAGRAGRADLYLYTLDLLLPVADLQQEAAYRPVGAAAWGAAALVMVGWLLATTIAVGVARVLRRP
ncbi:hypothetical protein [Phytohabitans houttuyneae]|uniref:hypothetical protein n=1 Tax=Phytohabitans houttuyneae TaxID=1076126 RepID=UPI0015658246|nr:hypothetical protein [Phytohabitans houttuyneae]